MIPKIIAAQINLKVGDIENNALRVIEVSKHCRDTLKAELVVFPELTLSGYPPEDLLLRPELYERCRLALLHIADALPDIAVIVGYPARHQDQSFNELAFIEKGVIQATYQKQELPNYGVFDEKRYFHAGDTPCVISFKGILIGLLICEDLWHPAAIAQAKKAGAQLIISINASPFDRHKIKSRQTVMQTRAKEANLPIIYVNLVGGQDELVFDGGSFVMSANGQCLQQGQYFKEELLLIKDLTQQPQAPLMSEEAFLYQALVLGVQDYVNKNGFPGVLLGLSGGIDSALTLCIAVDALGKDRVQAVMMPSCFTQTISLTDAQLQATSLGVKYQEISIEPMFKAFLQGLSPIFKNETISLTEENLQARVRGTLLMALSNQLGYMVLNTSNKSELAVGYGTLYGDMVGGFAALKDVPKTCVYRLAHYRNQISLAIPERVITRAPSAELRDNQTDQDSLPDYEILDAILKAYIEEDLEASSIIAKGFAKETVEKIIRLVNKNEYKRRQAPPGTRLSERAFGKDRRYPITSRY